MAVGIELSWQYSITCCCCTTAGSRAAVWQNGVWSGSVNEEKVWNRIPLCGKNGNHWHSLMLAECLRRPNSGCEHSEVMGGAFQQCQQQRGCQATFCTAVTPQNEEHLYHLICKDWWIKTRKLRMELNISFNVLKTMMPTLDSKVSATMLIQEQKGQHMQVCQDLLISWQYDAEGDSFLDLSVTDDEAWCHHYELESKQRSMGWQHVNSPLKKKMKMQPAESKVMCTVSWDRKGVWSFWISWDHQLWPLHHDAD